MEEYAIAVAQFTHDIETFASERNLDIDLHPIIDDRRIELYDLGQAAGSQEVDTQDIDWDTVAAELGFSPSQNDVALQLQTCWDVNLAAFLEVMAQHEASSHAGDDDDDDDFQDAPQSPQLLPQQDDRPPSSSSKRPAQEEAPSSRNSKRARLDRNAEIPSTPDHALAVRRHDERVSSPSRRRLFAEVRDSQADSQATLSRPRIEVQVTPRRAPHQSSRDVTPSQQLMQESHFVDAEPSGSPHLGTAAAPTRKAKRRTLPSSFRSPEAQPQWQPASDPPIVVDDDPDAADSFNNPDPVPSPAHAQNSLSTIEDWIDHYESLGYAHDIVIRVLEATTMTPGGPASHAMEALRRGEPLPPNHEGVWTDRDDAALRQVLVAGVPGPLDREPVDEHDARTLAAAVRELSRLEYKHGAERVRLRAQFLEALEQEGELDE